MQIEHLAKTTISGTVRTERSEQGISPVGKVQQFGRKYGLWAGDESASHPVNIFPWFEIDSTSTKQYNWLFPAQFRYRFAGTQPHSQPGIRSSGRH